MENKDVFMAAYERAEEKNSLRHSLFPRAGSISPTLLTSPELDKMGEVVRHKTAKRIGKTVRKLDKKTRKLGKRVMKTGENVVDTVATVGGWYGKE